MLDPNWTKRLIESARRVLWADPTMTAPVVTQETLLEPFGLRGPSNEAERLLLLGVVEDVRIKFVAQRGTISVPMTDMLSYIRARTRDHTLRRSTVAVIHGHSDSWMSHNFMKEVGVSFQEFVNQLRVADGARLLRSTDASIKEIALTVGFKDANSFPRLFKRRYGQSAAQWRRAHQAPD